MGAGGGAGVGGLAYGGGEGWKEEIDDVLRASFSLAVIIHRRCDGSFLRQFTILLFVIIATHVFICSGGR